MIRSRPELVHKDPQDEYHYTVRQTTVEDYVDIETNCRPGCALITAPDGGALATPNQLRRIAQILADIAHELEHGEYPWDDKPEGTTHD